MFGDDKVYGICEAEARPSQFGIINIYIDLVLSTFYKTLKSGFRTLNFQKTHRCPVDFSNSIPVLLVNL